jgi:hypothetical protein
MVMPLLMMITVLPLLPLLMMIMVMLKVIFMIAATIQDFISILKGQEFVKYISPNWDGIEVGVMPISICPVVRPGHMLRSRRAEANAIAKAIAIASVVSVVSVMDKPDVAVNTSTRT